MKKAIAVASLLLTLGGCFSNKDIISEKVDVAPLSRVVKNLEGDTEGMVHVDNKSGTEYHWDAKEKKLYVKKKLLYDLRPGCTFALDDVREATSEEQKAYNMIYGDKNL